MTNQERNIYGDQLIQRAGQSTGGEISSQREDELDQAVLLEAQKLVQNTSRGMPTAYDIGCGEEATMAIKFAKAGCRTIACDMKPMPRLQDLAKPGGNIAPEHILQGNAQDMNWAALPKPDILYSQRFLHYLRFQEAAKLLQDILREAKGCKIYLSLSGIHSELSSGYEAAPLQSRFAPLQARMAKKHGIHQNICLYAPEDAEALAKASGIEASRIWTSPFGNVKMIASQAPRGPREAPKP